GAEAELADGDVGGARDLPQRRTHARGVPGAGPRRHFRTPVSDRLRGRVALITGASRGIGLATSKALAAEGTQVAMLSRSADALQSHAAEIGANAMAFPCDITDPHALEQTLAAVRRMAGEPNVLVNN